MMMTMMMMMSKLFAPPPGRPPVFDSSALDDQEPGELPYWSGSTIYEGRQQDEFMSVPAFETNRPIAKISGPPIASSNSKVYGPGISAPKGAAAGPIDDAAVALGLANLGQSSKRHVALSDLFPVLSNVFPALETERSRHEDDEAFGKGRGFGLGAKREPNQAHPSAIEREEYPSLRRARHRSVERERRLRESEQGDAGDGGIPRGNARRLEPVAGRSPEQQFYAERTETDGPGGGGAREEGRRERSSSRRRGKERDRRRDKDRDRDRDRQHRDRPRHDRVGGNQEEEEEEEEGVLDDGANRRRRRKSRNNRGPEEPAGPGAQSAQSRAEVPESDNALRLMQLQASATLPSVNVLEGAGDQDGRERAFPMFTD